MDIQRIINLVKETKGIITNREMAAHVKEKGVADYVTQVDVAVQDFLKKELYILAPDIQFLGEETGLQQMNTDCYWILDPVDGKPTSCTTISIAWFRWLFAAKKRLSWALSMTRFMTSFSMPSKAKAVS